MAEKLFTLEEANKMLPALREVVSLLRERMGWLSSNKPAVPYLIEEYKIPRETMVPVAYFQSLLQVRNALGTVESLGCQLKDIERGLVDFPAKLSGREILLCWRLGEESIGYYHDLRSGYEGRRPLPSGGVDGPDGAVGGGETH